MGQAEEEGNAVQYVTRNQALKKLQIKLPEFRRLCILKGIHPREPRKKTQGQNKTYYHVKDINYLAHEPLVNKLREAQAYERKIKKAKAKKNRDLAQRLASLRPTYRLDHLVKERYPSFVDALRDLDDPLTMVHLFAVLPAEDLHGIPAKAVAVSQRLALEWQAWVVRTASLRRTFVSVKGFYFQAEVMGQSVTWLVPHALSQVLPTDVDYRVMLTFLEFYHTLLQFVNYKLYHTLGVQYPPIVDPKLEKAAAGLESLMQDLAKGKRAALEAPKDAQDRPERANPEVEKRLESLPAKLRELQAEVAKADSKQDGSEPVHGTVDDDEEGEAESSDEDVGSIESGEDDDEGDGEEEEEGSERGSEDEEEGAAADEDMEEAAAGRSGVGMAETAGPKVAGGAAEVDPDDEAAVCGSLFKGLVFFLGREVPREALLLVIRSFGGAVGWQGDGSPIEESDKSITHQVVDRPRQELRYLTRQYVQPQWVVDSANFRVLADAELYAPGKVPPPHVSPFVDASDEGYVPDYARSLLKLQEMAMAARKRAAGQLQLAAFQEDMEGQEVAEAPSAEDAAAAAERQFAIELQEELRAGQTAGPDESREKTEEDDAEVLQQKPKKKRAAPADVEEDEEARMAAALLPRKTRNLYQSIQKRNKAKRARVEELERRRAALADAED